MDSMDNVYEFYFADVSAYCCTELVVFVFVFHTFFAPPAGEYFRSVEHDIARFYQHQSLWLIARHL